MSLIYNHANKEHWNRIPKQHWVHTWEYGLIQKRAGRTVTHLVARSSKGGHAVAYATLVTYPLFGNNTITYLPYGPVWLEEPSPEYRESLREYLYRYGRSYHSIAVRLELSRSLSGTIKTPWSLYRSSFHQPRGEAGLSLDHPLEEITASFSKNTRRNIKKSYKHNLETEILSGSRMVEQQEAFIALNEENARAHNTTTHSSAYFEQLFDVLKENPHNFLITVRDKDGPVAMNIFTVFGDRAYCPFGASNSRGKELSAYYHIKDQAITHLHDQRISHFNWGGIAVGKRDQNLSGLNQFKLGWGTEQVVHDDLYDIIINPLLYTLYVLRNAFKTMIRIVR